MSNTVKYNIYYATSPKGPWTKANSTPVEKLSDGNTFTIQDLTPGTQYYFTVVGGVEIDGTFQEQISQPIGPLDMKARGVNSLNHLLNTISARTLSIKTHGGGGLSHQFTVE